MSNGLSLSSFNERFELTNEKIESLRALESKLLEIKREEAKRKLVQEKSQLDNEVKQLKKKLISAEKNNGVFQVPLPQTSPVEDEQVVKQTPPAAVVTETAQKGDNAKKTKKNEGKKKNQSKPAAKNAGDATAEVDISKLDLRIGQIRSVKLHPNAESLYLEQMDVGEEKCRNVVTGVVKFVPIDQMENRKVIVLCNLKPSKIRGEVSQAMVMCASTPEKVEILDPPADAQPGDKVIVPGYEGVAETQINPKKKILEKILPDLRVDANCRACYKGNPLTVVGKGECKSQSLTNVQIK